MGIAEITGFIVLGFAMGAQLWLRSFLLTHRRKVIAIGASLIVVAIAILCWRQYQLWSIDPVGKFLLPPYRSMGYFWYYVGSRFALPWITSAACGFLVYWAAKILNKKFGEHFFEEEEPFFFGLAVFGCGYPALLIYVIIMALGSLFLSLLYFLLKKGRAPLYYLWFPMGIFAILVAYYVLPHEAFVKLKL
ncbi:MAG: hypothetical protein V1489_02415 [Candidatus Liptonbacteria bacterium]